MTSPRHRVPVWRWHAIALPALCASLMTGAALAQTVNPREEARAHLGPFYYTPRIAVHDFGVDTNVFNNADAKRDFTITLAPRARVWVPAGRRALMSATLGSDVVYYHTYTSERSVNPEFTVRGEVFLGRVTPFAETAYLSTRQRPNFEIDARSRREQRAWLGGVNLRVTPKLTVEVAGRQMSVDFAADATFNDINLRETLNRETQRASATARHELTPLTTIVLKAEAGRERFAFSPLRDANTVGVIPGVEFNPRALISGTAYVGFRRFSPKSPLLETFSGVVANASLRYTLLGSTQFTFTAERDVTYSYERVQPYFVVDGYGLSVRRQLIGRTDLTVGAQRFKYGYRNLLLTGSLAEDLGRVDLTRVLSVSFGYRLGRDVRFGIGTAYRERETTSQRFRNYRGARFATSIDYDF
jgi:hypothetical protein